VNKQQFVLNELGVLASDMTETVRTELQNLQEAEERREEARLKAGEHTYIGTLPLPYNSNHLKEEMDYFMDRLRAVNDYLFADRSDVASTTRFLSELARKLTT